MKFQKSVTIGEILKIFEADIPKILGKTSTILDKFSIPADAGEASFVYALTDKHLKLALKSRAPCVLTHIRFAEDLEKQSLSKTFLFSQNPELLARNIKQKLTNTPTPYKTQFSGIHPSASVHQSCSLGKNVVIGPNSVVAENCVLEDNVFVGANSIIEANVTLAEGTTIHALVYIGHSTLMGKNCEIMPNTTIASEGFGYAQDRNFNHYRIPHTGRVVLGDDVHIGANTSIDRGTLDDTTIDTGTKIDNQVHIAHNLNIGKTCLITAQVVTAGSSKIGNNFVVGGAAAINGHIEICDNVRVAGLSGVNHNITKPGTYAGFPIQPMKNFLRNQASFAKLGEIRKSVNLLKKWMDKSES